VIAPTNKSAGPIAVIWIHGSTANSYQPTYVRIARELAARRFTTIVGNDSKNADRMYDGEEAQVAQIIATWADTLVRR
jgi:hypothetical protein